VALILAIVIGTAFYSAYYALDCLAVASALAISTFLFHLFYRSFLSSAGSLLTRYVPPQRSLPLLLFDGFETFIHAI
jgi:hypothetical protein